MRYYRVLMSGAMAATTSLSFATEPATPAPADFSSGLEKLAALGVPKMDGARWVTGPVINQLRWNPAELWRGHFDHYLSTILGPVAAGAWSLPTTGEAPARAMFAGHPRWVPARPPVMPGYPEEMREQEEKAFVAQWKALKPADLAKEVDGVLARFDKQVKQWREQNSGSHGNNPWLVEQESQVTGGLMIFAAQLWQAGDKASANRVAAAVFSAASSRDRVLNAALTGLADAGLREASNALMATGDWRAYDAALRSLLKRFPRGWASAPAVEKLAGQVAARLSSSGEPVFPAGMTPDAPTREALLRLAQLAPVDAGAPRPIEDSRLHRLGLLPAPDRPPVSGANGYSYSSQPTVRPEVKALLGSRFAALPTLAAVLEDETLVLVPYVSSGSSYSSHETSEEKFRRSYNLLPRPMSRGEAARAMLLSVLPGEEYKMRDWDAAALESALESFVRDHAGDDAVTLAQVYLTDGEREQQDAAVYYLRHSSDPRATAALETWFLEGDLEGRLNDLKEYLRIDPKKTKAFAGRVVARLKENLALPDKRPEGEHSSSQRNGVTRMNRSYLEREIKAMEDLASAKTPRERLLDPAVLGDIQAFQAALRGMQAELFTMPFSERVDLLLEAAVSTQDPLIKSSCLTMMMNLGSRSGGTSTAAAYAVPAADSPEARRWKTLLGDGSSVPGMERTTVGMLAARIFEALIEPVPPLVGLAQGFGGAKGTQSIFLRRAQARLAGQPVPAYPTVATVTAPRLQALVDRLAATPDAEFESMFGSDNPDENLALSAWWFGQLYPEVVTEIKVELPEVSLPEALARRMRVLGALPTTIPHLEKVSAADRALTEELLAAAGMKVGEVVDAARLDALVALMARDSARYSGVLVNFGPRGTLPGYYLRATCPTLRPAKPGQPVTRALPFLPVTPEEGLSIKLNQFASLFKHAGDHGFQGSDAGLNLGVFLGKAYLNRIWRVKDGVVTAPEPLDAEQGAMLPKHWQLIVLSARDAAVINGETPAPATSTPAMSPEPVSAGS